MQPLRDKPSCEPGGGHSPPARGPLHWTRSWGQVVDPPRHAQRTPVADPSGGQLCFLGPGGNRTPRWALPEPTASPEAQSSRPTWASTGGAIPGDVNKNGT